MSDLTDQNVLNGNRINKLKVSEIMLLRTEVSTDEYKQNYSDENLTFQYKVSIILEHSDQFVIDPLRKCCRPCGTVPAVNPQESRTGSPGHSFTFLEDARQSCWYQIFQILLGCERASVCSPLIHTTSSVQDSPKYTEL